jgi:hypothetical protein
MQPDFEGAAGEATGLALTVVRYTDRPDRCTVYPPKASGDARMSRWLTVDRAACVDLGATR